LCEHGWAILVVVKEVARDPVIPGVASIVP
jgi:hypothetical protein